MVVSLKWIQKTNFDGDFKSGPKPARIDHVRWDWNEAPYFLLAIRLSIVSNSQLDVQASLKIFEKVRKFRYTRVWFNLDILGFNKIKLIMSRLIVHDFSHFPTQNCKLNILKNIINYYNQYEIYSFLHVPRERNKVFHHFSNQILDKGKRQYGMLCSYGLQ